MTETAKIQSPNTEQFKALQQYIISKSQQRDNLQPPLTFAELESYFTDAPHLLQNVHYEPLHLSHATLHLGQLKLFLNELRFISHETKITRQNRDYDFIFYVGSSPGTHLKMLADLFPDIRFICVDPAEHNIKYSRSYNSLPYWRADVNDPQIWRDRASAENPLFLRESLYFRVSQKTAFPNAYIRMVNDCGKIVNIQKRDAISSSQLSIDLIGKWIVANISLLRDFRFLIIEMPCDEQLAKSLAFISQQPRINTLYISDIRTNLSSQWITEMIAAAEPIATSAVDIAERIKALNLLKTGKNALEKVSFPSESDILLNNIQQRLWLIQIQPRVAMLKYHPPYFTKETHELDALHLRQFFTQFALPRQLLQKAMEQIPNYDPLADFDAAQDTQPFFHSIDLQAFAGANSGETRLILHRDECDNYKKSITISSAKFEGYLYAFNRIRDMAYFSSNKPYIDLSLGICCCADCTNMVRIFREYLTAHWNISSDEMADTIKSLIYDLIVGDMHRSLSADNHPFAFRAFNSPTEYFQRITALRSIELIRRSP
ncbi:MAG: hypothetical protein M0R33_15600 [Methylomonas sp.]|jgi:hypothetical protein|uniref:hypothetical protein n=1 Tax=Methylomonas sp. TaxID=418 RepID=UPI0025CFF274|nr:hypothetical protein [Methylomonas sp.]MCK9607868.1 hypothetical protein [Methylomonas sp.]